jgi:hypothetical protein
MKMRETTNLCPHCGGTGKRLMIMPRPILRAGIPSLHEVKGRRGFVGGGIEQRQNRQ